MGLKILFKILAFIEISSHKMYFWKGSKSK